MSSSSLSGRSSPRSPVQLARSDSKTNRLSRAQGSSRIRPHTRTASSSNASEQAYRDRHEFELEQDLLFFGAASSSTDGGSPKSGFSPINTARHGHPSRPKVRDISAIHSGSPSSSSCSEAPKPPGGTTSLRQQAALARCPQAHQRPYELPFAVRNPVRPGKDIQVPLVSPVSPVFPSLFPLSSSSRPSQRPRTPGRHTPVPLTPKTSLSSFESPGSAARVPPQTSGLVTPSRSPQSRKSASHRYVVFSVFCVYLLHPFPRSAICHFA